MQYIEKIKYPILFTLMIVLTISLGSSLSVEANEKKPEVTPNELIEFGVEPNKAQSLAEKINNGR
ncbi:hypothetical protein [Salinicoccus albus]|uniref:hypothetical protein n=1 Tax=Salinicoccus albus TaxID=418756 RepID=UPI0003654EFA|nr:hypothetical protein [Salinicoccus albus]